MTPEHNKAVAEELVKQRGAEHVRHEFVAWTLSEGCRAVFVLAPGQAPSGGICLPGVMTEVNAHLRPLGAPQPGDYDPTFPGWDFVPSFFVPFGFMLGRLKPTANVQETVDYILRAEEFMREEAGTVGQALDFARDTMPFEQTPPFLIPVGYMSLGRTADAEAFMAACTEHFANGPMAQTYARFVERIRAQS